MSGTLILQNRRTGSILLSHAASLGLAAVITAAVLRFLPFRGAARAVTAAAAAVLAFWLSYPPIADRTMPGDGTVSVPWKLTKDTLILDGRSIPRDTIVRVHVWPCRTPMGQSRPGLMVNIETTGRNELLSSPLYGERVEEGVQSLRALVRALDAEEREE